MPEDAKERIRSEITYDVLTREDLPLLARLIDGMRRERDDTLQLRAFSPEYYDWIYFRNPAGAAVVFAGKHHGEVVTSFAITPKRIQFGDEVVLCGKTMDMFTHPDYQGMGLIGQVTSRVFQEARARGIQMWYVTPSSNSYPIFRGKWGYVESVPVNYVVRVLDHTSTFGAVVRPNALGRVAGAVVDASRRLGSRDVQPASTFEVREERYFGSETDALWARCHGYGVALVRNAPYLTWRYLENPDHYDVHKFYLGTALRGILVTKFTRRRGLKVGELVDLVSVPWDREVRSAMLKFAVRKFSDSRCAFAQGWAIEDSTWEAELRAQGLGRRRRKMAILFSPEASRLEFYDPQAWLLTQGDGNDL